MSLSLRLRRLNRGVIAGLVAVFVLVRVGEQIHALHDTCAHAGCSLSDGTVVGDTIQCGCHGSRFKLADGSVVVGPATFDQPSYEVRRADGKLEARRVR